MNWNKVQVTLSEFFASGVLLLIVTALIYRGAFAYEHKIQSPIFQKTVYNKGG